MYKYFILNIYTFLQHLSHKSLGGLMWVQEKIKIQNHEYKTNAFACYYQKEQHMYTIVMKGKYIETNEIVLVGVYASVYLSACVCVKQDCVTDSCVYVRVGECSIFNWGSRKWAHPIGSVLYLHRIHRQARIKKSNREYMTRVLAKSIRVTNTNIELPNETAFFYGVHVCLFSGYSPQEWLHIVSY